MRLRFEEWILSQEISTDAKDLINEALLCYKATAYKASLLFSYLCFQTIIRDRMLNAHKPDNISQGLWDDILKNLRNEDKWDSTVYDNLQRQSPKEIFLLNDDIRNQITFWKNRRNDCAHSKNNKITVSHVESFWTFIRSNLPKIMVNGSREALINKIKRHFDVSLTAPNADITYIVNEVPQAIEESDLNVFFETIFNYFTDTTILWDIDQSYISFWEKLFLLNNEKVTRYLVQFMKSNENLVMPFLRAFPNRVNYFSSDASFIRNLWHSKIFENAYDPKGDLKLYCAILRNDLIAYEEQDEAKENIVRKISNIIPDEDDFYILNKNDFFVKFKEIIFGTSFLNNFDRANNRRDIITYYLQQFPLDELVVRAITSTFDTSNHPWHLRDALNEFFIENPEKRDSFITILGEYEIEPPCYLSSIKEAVS
ncbi:hypothetical protein DCE79_06310 [Lysinibacillus sp. 2017]|uniref:hypothetical protein n=1 Tax=unclassified Lysinibacillus TaxID=2636778 RepID=UPI000D52682A|nr:MULTISPECIES: hypothetical protein [unclassified Lysinibacillus]AWE07039.1 hypothetical protein DCE79_06310 [Lysinibacillus sp. 2017]TGN37038.1 hypothetical protein E4L99_00700 [Lysinibacillus sp. S2017]